MRSDTVPDQVTLPAIVVAALVEVAARTDVGAAILLGFRAGHPLLGAPEARTELVRAADGQVALRIARAVPPVKAQQA